MDENKSPQDFLNEIFEKSQAAAPPMPQPRFEPSGDDSPRFEPPEDDPPPTPPPDGPAEKHGADGGAKFLPWLCVVLGAALLVLGVCLLQLVRMNHRLDGLQQAVEAVQSMDDLRKENERLQEQLDQREQEYHQLWQALQDFSAQSNSTLVQKRRLDYLWYMGQFMDHGDYPMAALAAVLSGRGYFPDSFIVDSQAVYLNPEQTAQYQAYTQELIDRGYLEEEIDHAHVPLNSQLPPTQVVFAAQWDPEKNLDMAALGILWCALDACYVADAPERAAQYLIRYQWYELYSPGEWESGGDCYPQRILDTASDYTIQQYEQLIQYLIASGWLTETGGILYYKEGQVISDVLYDLPFVPPGGYLYGEIPVN